MDAAHAFHISRSLLEEAEKHPEDKRFAKWRADDEAVRAAVASSLPETDWAMFSQDLYWAFWRHKMYDVFVPTTEYTDYLTRLDADVRKAQAVVARPPDSRDSRAIRKAKRELDELKVVRAQPLLFRLFLCSARPRREWSFVTIAPYGCFLWLPSFARPFVCFRSWASVPPASTTTIYFSCIVSSLPCPHRVGYPHAHTHVSHGHY